MVLLELIQASSAHTLQPPELMNKLTTGAKEVAYISFENCSISVGADVRVSERLSTPQLFLLLLFAA